MKYIAAVLTVAMMAGAAFAAPKAPKAPALKITKISGTVNLMKDGLVVMTLKPGVAVPNLVDNSMTFEVVEGSIEVLADGKTVTANTGSNFTVSSVNGQTNVYVQAGTPVEVKAGGNTVAVAPNSSIKLVTSAGKTEISVEKGNAAVTNASGGQVQALEAGQKVEVLTPAAAPAPVTQAPVTDEPAVTEPVVIPPAPVIVPSVIPTQEVQESQAVSGSNP